MTAATLSRPWYATNARNLLELRQRNLKPAEPVVVSLIGGAPIGPGRSSPAVG